MRLHFKGLIDGRPRMCLFSYVRTFHFCSSDLDIDLDLDAMTLIYELNVDILKMYRF